MQVMAEQNGVDVADFENSGVPGLAVANFDNEMIGLYRPLGRGLFEDIALKSGVGAVSRNSLGFGCGPRIASSHASACSLNERSKNECGAPG